MSTLETAAMVKLRALKMQDKSDSLPCQFDGITVCCACSQPGGNHEKTIACVGLRTVVRHAAVAVRRGSQHCAGRRRDVNGSALSQPDAEQQCVRPRV